MSIQNERVKERIEQLGLSLSEVTKLSGVPKSTLHRYVTGERENIPTSVLKALASALKTTPDYLAGWVENPNAFSSTLAGVADNSSTIASVISKLKPGDYNISAIVAAEGYKLLKKQEDEFIHAVSNFLCGDENAMTLEMIEQVQQYARFLVEQQKAK